MREIQLLIWNDNQASVDAWKTAAERDGFRRVTPLTSKAVSEIVAIYRQLKPDAAILDLVDDQTEKPIGLRIASEIQAVDPLAPVIVLTRKPEGAYETNGYLRWQGLAGIYPRGIVDVSGQFKDIVVTESLLVKHLLQPEYTLARYCGLHVDGFEEWNDDLEIALALRDAVYRLPWSGSSDAWHPVLCDAVHEALIARGWHEIAQKYRHAIAIFQQSDPFYMAGSTSRRHLSHNVQVCLLGLALLLSDGPIREIAMKQMKGRLLDAVLVWCCIGTAHDAAYLSEHFEAVSGRLAELGDKFSGFVKAQPLQPWTWPTDHHATVAARMWDAGNVVGEEALACTLIAAGIAKHDAKYLKTATVCVEQWQEFLAILCDELQDWQRERPGAVPGIASAPTDRWKNVPWRLVEPLRLETKRRSDGTHSIGLEFMVVDHSKLIREREGTPSVTPVGQRFDQILGTLKTHLRSSRPIEVQLAAHFVTRQAASIVRSQALLP